MPPLPPLSLYIHFPWCEKKCPYCDFNSHLTAEIPQQQYTQSLVNDLKQSLHHVQGRAVQTIFFGGGTPSLMSTDALAIILEAINNSLSLTPNAEITLEANPGSAEREKFSHYQQLGINRLSLGIQSFNEQCLEKLGRIHNSVDAKQAIEMAYSAGFNNINVDLMVGLPNQSPQNALDDLTQALTFETPHISWYELTIEPNTAFYSKPPKLPIEYDLEQMETQGRELLSKNGYQRYEISAYARDNQTAQHNLNYWHYGDYLGIGAGAHSKISNYDIGGNLIIQRFSKRKQPQGYMQSQNEVATNNVIHENRLSDYLLNGLRLTQGFSFTECMQRIGLSQLKLELAFNKLQSDGFIDCLGDKVMPTQQGLCFQNEAIIQTTTIIT